MSLVLVDTSAWIHYLRNGKGGLAVALEELLEEDRAALTGLALAEVRQGLRPTEERPALELLDLLPWIDATRNDFARAGNLLATLRRRGISIPTIDGVIAAQCLERGLPLLENDWHFSEIEGLQRHSWRDGEQ